MDKPSPTNTRTGISVLFYCAAVFAGITGLVKILEKLLDHEAFGEIVLLWLGPSALLYLASKLLENWVCSECGNKVAETSKLCPSCSVKFQSAEEKGK